VIFTYPCWELQALAVGFLAKKIHHGDTEFTEVARNVTRGWSLSKNFRVEKQVLAGEG